MFEIVQPQGNATRLGINVYKWTGSGMTMLWSTSDIGQGAGALSWLVADIDGDGRAEIIQPWDNASRLGMIVYKWTGTGMATMWGTSDMGQGAGAMSWLVADLDDDGRAEIVQPWYNAGRLGMIVYKWTGAEMATVWGTSDMGQGSKVLSWLVADLNGGGRAEIVHPWNNAGKLAMTVYGWKANRMAVIWNTSDIGQGPGALSWLVADIDGDGRAEIVQPWDNAGQLGMIAYKWTGTGMATLWGASAIGQGSPALSWLVADIDGDGRAEIVQPWDNAGKLGMIAYKWTGTGMATFWGTGDLGHGPLALTWLVGDVNGDGRAEIVQPWDNAGQLGMTVYGWTGSGMAALGSTSDIGQRSDALSWLVGDIAGQ